MKQNSFPADFATLHDLVALKVRHIKQQQQQQQQQHFRSAHFLRATRSQNVVEESFGLPKHIARSYISSGKPPHTKTDDFLGNEKVNLYVVLKNKEEVRSKAVFSSLNFKIIHSGMG